ncbi:unnamed protein product, partial [Adineta ricciae]
AQMNKLIGFVIVAWIIVPIAYYTNLWNSKSMPIVSNRVFTVDGYYYNVSSVLDSRLHLNETAYERYGILSSENILRDLRLPVMFAFSYATSFASITAVIVHTVLYYGKTILKQFRSSLNDNSDDIHAKLMSRYDEAPCWWYMTLFVVAFTLATLVCHFGDLMPWYHMFTAVTIAFVFVLPTGIVQALTNQSIELSPITELIAGFLMPGKPIANVTFKTYGSITHHQALSLISDLKFGHYMKIPPRAIFVTQLTSTVVAGVVNYVSAIYIMDTVPHICTLENPNWKCPKANVFYSASIIWGAIGPAKIFGTKSLYSPLLLGFLAGALLPIPTWLLTKKYPKTKWLKYIHFPIMLSATAIIPPASPGNYPSWLMVGFLF